MNPENNPTIKKKKKKKHHGFTFIILLLVLIIGACAVFYFYQRKKASNTVSAFLSSAQEMNLDSMSYLLQDNDVSALKNADVDNPIFQDFFTNINQKMSFRIVKNQFHFTNNTARVTARIRYIDGTEIYKATVSEFLRQIVSTAFSGNSLSEEETQQKLADILKEQSSLIKDTFVETDITYPVIKIKDTWKIVSLDEETVKIMSANFVSVQNEIANSIDASQNGVDASPIASPDSKIDMTTDKFTIRYTQHRIAKDFSGQPCLMLYYDYTNNSTSASSAMVDVGIQAYQNQSLCEATIPEGNDTAVDHYMSEIQPGQTVNVCQVFLLKDTSDVTIEASEAFNFGGGQITTQILKVQ